MSTGLIRHDRDTDTQAVSLTLPKSVLLELDMQADLDGCNRSVLVGRILKEHFKRHV